MRKSFRVATVFTGAAACAAVFTPAAHAAPAAPGATAGITPKALTHNNCTAGELDWFHLYYTAAENHPTPACFAGTGTYVISSNKRFAFFCAGNNSGYLGTDIGRIPFSGGSIPFNLHSHIVHSVHLANHRVPSARC